jgi:uncharacterized coiled-coil DUF342 family protein
MEIEYARLKQVGDVVDNIVVRRLKQLSPEDVAEIRLLYMRELMPLENQRNELLAELDQLRAEPARIAKGLEQERAALVLASRERSDVNAEIVALKQERDELIPEVRALREVSASLKRAYAESHRILGATD